MQTNTQPNQIAFNMQTEQIHPWPFSDLAHGWWRANACDLQVGGATQRAMVRLCMALMFIEVAKW